MKLDFTQRIFVRKPKTVLTVRFGLSTKTLTFTFQYSLLVPPWSGFLVGWRGLEQLKHVEPKRVHVENMSSWCFDTLWNKRSETFSGRFDARWSSHLIPSTQTSCHNSQFIAGTCQLLVCWNVMTVGGAQVRGYLRREEPLPLDAVLLSAHSWKCAVHDTTPRRGKTSLSTEWVKFFMPFGLKHNRARQAVKQLFPAVFPWHSSPDDKQTSINQILTSQLIDWSVTALRNQLWFEIVVNCTFSEVTNSWKKFGWTMLWLFYLKTRKDGTQTSTEEAPTTSLFQTSVCCLTTWLIKPPET